MRKIVRLTISSNTMEVLLLMRELFPPGVAMTHFMGILCAMGIEFDPVAGLAITYTGEERDNKPVIGIIYSPAADEVSPELLKLREENVISIEDVTTETQAAVIAGMARVEAELEEQERNEEP